MTKEIQWYDEPQEHDYPAAEEYLSLLFSCIKARKLRVRLADKDMTSYKAKDIFRASDLPHLDKDNYHVKKNLEKIKKGEKLSPILLVKEDIKVLHIADGYHRLCAVYIHNEDARIPCKICAEFEVD